MLGIFFILVIMWALGMISSYTFGGAIHLLLVFALIVLVIRLAQGRSVHGERAVADIQSDSMRGDGMVDELDRGHFEFRWSLGCGQCGEDEGQEWLHVSSIGVRLRWRVECCSFCAG